MDIPPLLEPKDDTPTSKIMSTTLETMRKDYKDDADIINELTNAAERLWTLTEVGMGNMSL